MPTLHKLLSTDSRRHFLESRGVYFEAALFKQYLTPPSSQDLIQRLSSKNPLLIYTSHPLSADYGYLGSSQLIACQQLTTAPEIDGLLFWLNTDCHDANGRVTRLMGLSQRHQNSSAIPFDLRWQEIRFAPLQSEELGEAIDNLNQLIVQEPSNRNPGLCRLQELRDVVLIDPPKTLAALNYRLTQFLLQRQLHYFPRSRLASEVMAQGPIIEQINHFLNRRVEAIRAFNAALKELKQEGIGRRLSPIRHDYLPLYYTCPRDSARLKLAHLQEGGNHFAIAKCPCKRTYRFFLGSRSLSITALVKTGRWSWNRCLPLFMNRFVSGYIANPKTAIFGLLLNRVLEQALDQAPVPIYLAPPLKGPPNNVPNSLMYAYLNGLESTH